MIAILLVLRTWNRYCDTLIGEIKGGIRTTTNANLQSMATLQSYSRRPHYYKRKHSIIKDSLTLTFAAWLKNSFQKGCYKNSSESYVYGVTAGKDRCS